MTILVFQLTDADGTWYAWPTGSPQLYPFRSNADAQRFAKQLAETRGGTPVHVERSIEQTAALV